MDVRRPGIDYLLKVTSEPATVWYDKIQGKNDVLGCRKSERSDVELILMQIHAIIAIEAPRTWQHGKESNGKREAEVLFNPRWDHINSSINVNK